jgi:DNA repair exonuclease SbcCD ATPase subunit
LVFGSAAACSLVGEPSRLDGVADRDNLATMTEAIIRLQHVSFEGAGLYMEPSGKIPLAKQGKVLLCGEEGAGKSMIPEVTTLVLHGKGSPRLRKNGLVESSIVNAATGYKGEVTFDAGTGTASRHVSITQAFKHARLKSRYVINVDGIREEPTTKPEQKKLVRRLAPLSYEEWLGVVYLPQGGIHDLLAGTPTEKREYLTSVFGLDFYDDLLTAAKEEHKDLVAKVSGALDLQRRLADLNAEIQELDEELDKLPSREELEAAVEKHNQKLQDISRELGELGAAQKNADKLHQAKARLDRALQSGSWKSAKEAAISEKTQTDLVDKLTTELASHQAQLREAEKLNTIRSSAEAEVKRRELAAKAAQEKLALCMEALEEVFDKDTLERFVAVLRPAVDEIEDFDMKYEKVKLTDEPWPKLLAQRDAVESQADKLEKLAIKLQSSHQQAQCPTCAHDLDISALKATVSGLRDQAKKLHRQAVAKLTHDVMAIGNEIDGNVAAMLKKAESGLSKHAAHAEALAAQTRAAERLTDAQEALAKAPSPVDTDKLEAAAEKLEEKARNARLLLQSARQASAASAEVKTMEESLGDVDLDGLDAAVEDLKTKYEKSKARYEAAVATKERSTQLRSTIKALNKQRTDVDNRIAEHAETALKIKAYELELIPYFNALRAAKVKACTAVLEQVLPVYVGAMSANQYSGAELKLSVSDDLKDVDLQLRAGRHMPWISAIQASGGQRRRFTLAIIAALREVSPRKANAMFFDEPFADLEGEGKLLFVNRLVPTLMDRCPDLESMFLIAHDAEILQAGADAFDNVWLVERDERGSHLRMDQKLSRVAAR